MTVKCLKVTISKKQFDILVLFKPGGPKNAYDDDYYVTGSEYYDIDTFTARFDLKENVLYEVFGIMIYEGIVRFLVISENNLTPEWFPSGIFQIIDSRLPYDWSCNVFQSDNKEGTVIGYKELANNYSHMLGLLERNPRDIKIFLQVKEKTEYFE